jgi:hypothetical protein
MKRPVEEEALDHLAGCQICARRVERTVELIEALRRERDQSIRSGDSRFRRRVRPASDF